MSEHRPPTPDSAGPSEKKPRLDFEPEGANAAPVRLDAPVDAMILDSAPSRSTDRPKSGKVSKNKARKAKKKEIEPYSNDHLIHIEINEMLGEDVVAKAEEEGSHLTPPFEKGTVLELTVDRLSPSGT